MQIRSLVLAMWLVSSAQLGAQPAPPKAPVGPVVDTLHGIPIADPFRELENTSGQDVKAWVAAQDRYARTFAAGSVRRRSIRASIGSIAEATVYSAPIHRGVREFYSTFKATGPGAGINIFVRPVGATRPGAVLPGLDRHRRQSGEVALLYVPSPDGNLVAVGLARGQTPWLTVRIIDVRNGRLLPDSLPRFYRPLASLSWTPSGDALVYDHFVPDSTYSSRGVNSGSVRISRLGSAGVDREIMAPIVERNQVVRHALGAGGRHLAIIASNTDTRVDRLWVADLDRGTAATPVALPSDGSYSLAGEWRGTLYFLTWAGAPRGRVVALTTSTGGWSEVVPEQADPINTWPGVGANLLGGRLLVAYSRESRIELKSTLPDGTDARAIALPRLGSVWSGFVGRPDRSEVFYQLQGVADPGTVYRLDLGTGVSTRYLVPRLGYDPDSLITERLLYPGKDGTKIPIHIVRRADTPLDASAT